VLVTAIIQALRQAKRLAFRLVRCKRDFEVQPTIRLNRFSG
jgi:hypothetical protein